MKRCVAVAIIVLAGCTDSVATDCSTHVVGTWKSTIPAVDDAGNARPTPVLELVVRYKEDKTFVSLMKEPAEPKEGYIDASGFYTCTNNQLTLSVEEVGGQSTKGSDHSMITTYDLKKMAQDSFDNYWREENTTLHFKRSSATLADHLRGTSP